MTPTPTSHIPVLLEPMIQTLAPRDGKVYIDGTFGAGGYTRVILAQAACRVVAFDRDPDAASRYENLPDDMRARCNFIDAPFSRLADELQVNNIEPVDGVVLDLGVSSPQIDQAERGFSFRFDGPLDMRMDPRVGSSAADIVNTTPEQELADILYQLGEERQSRAIARAIVAQRAQAPITTTGQLAAIIRRIVRQNPKDSSDPATRSFQALRLHVNQELPELQAVLVQALGVLAPGGRLVVVTFHSLEDRIVKQFFIDHSGRAARPSRHVPEQKNAMPAWLEVPKKSLITANQNELARNPRARSAKLRYAIRTSTPWHQGAA
jgi:16S rRNA (cytosine1402-N4)-methyltransferase